MEKLIRDMKDLAEAAPRAQRSRQASKDAQEQVRKWMENATPQQREAARKLAEQMKNSQGHSDGSGSMRGAGDPGAMPANTTPAQQPFAQPREVATKPVDARQRAPAKPAASERVIADWYSNQPVDRANPGLGSTSAEEILQAAQSAERASEQQVIPPRYRDLIKGVFKRNLQNVPAERPIAPPAAPPER